MEEGRRRRSPPCHGRSHRRLRRRRAAEMALVRKVRELRRLVPGASSAMPADRLLLRTADYIVRLRAKVELLRALSELIADTNDHGWIIGSGGGGGHLIEGDDDDATGDH